ncbi:MAG: acetolactate decarboxylase [Gammaproteobacteria bacterium]
MIEQSKQQEFHQLSGTLVGWYAPAMMNGIKSPGFHFHFVDDERHIGGHVLAFSVPEGHLSYQVMSGFTVEF